MPKRIEQVFDEPVIRDVIAAIGLNSVSLQVEFELIRLASLMSVGGNLNKAQITFIASQLIETFPNETIADFKLCFQRGAIGQYGDIQRMDGITIRDWMTKYLDEKYQIREDMLMKEKEQIYKPVQDADKKAKEWLAKWLESIQDKRSGPSMVKDMDKDEIALEGKEKPLKRQHKQDPNYHKQLLISMTAGKYYRNKPYDYTRMQSFMVDGFQIVAMNLEEAREIYELVRGEF